MKSMRTALGVFVVVGLAVVSASATAEQGVTSPALSPTAVVAVGSVASLAVAQIPLACQGSGASDVRHRNHQIKNTTAYPIPKGTVIHWNASNKDSGNVTLAAALAPTASIDVSEPGQTNGYSCTAEFNPGEPDYVVKNLAWASPSHGSVTMEVANANPWVDAPRANLQLKSMKCPGQMVIGLTIFLDAIPKGGQKTFTTPFNGAGADYLEATINFDNKVPEANKANNVAKSIEFNTNRSCTPQ